MSNKTENPTHLETVIDAALTHLETLQPDTEAYAQTVDQLVKLNDLLPKKEPIIKPDQIVGLIANLGGIVAILNYERAHVITSKALSFVPKLHI